MIKQHTRRFKRTISGLLIYTIAALYIFLFLIKAIEIDKYIKVLVIIIFFIVIPIAYYVEAKKGTFNNITISEEGIEIKGLSIYTKIFWNEISSIRLICEEYGLEGLNERYYGIYYKKNNNLQKTMISYSTKVDEKIRMYYKRNN